EIHRIRDTPSSIEEFHRRAFMNQIRIIQAKHFAFGFLFLLLISSASHAQDFTHNLIDDGSVIAREERFGNMDRLSSPIAPTAQNRPPVFSITPDTRTIRVGEKITFKFAFRDPDNDPYFAGVVASTARV